MPILDFNPADFTVRTVTVYGESAPSGVATRQGAWIRRVAGDPQRYARDGLLLEAAYFETPHIPMSGLTEIFGLDIKARFARNGIDAEANIQLQVSLDQGVTYLAWTGAAWVAQALTGAYNSRAEFDEHCAALQLLNPRQVGFRIKILRDAATDSTPRLTGFRVYVEWRYDAHFDLMDTIRELFVSRARVPVLRMVVMTAAANSFSFQDEYALDVTRPVSVYNVTTDPQRNTNLFSEYNEVSHTIFMTGVQAQNAQLEIHFYGGCNAIIVRQDETVKLSELPITVIRLETRTDVNGRNTGNHNDYKVGTTTRRVRVRQHPVVRDVSVTVEHWTRNSREAIKSMDVHRALLSSAFRLKATGETPAFIETTEGRLDDIPSESYYAGIVGGSLRLFFHSQAYTTYYGVSRILFSIGSTTDRWTTDSITVGAQA